MDKKAKIQEYEIQNGVFRCKVETSLQSEELVQVRWKDERTKLISEPVRYRWGEGGRLCVTTDFLVEKFAIRTWRLVLVLAGGEEWPVSFVGEGAEFGKMLSLAKTEVIPERNVHLIPALDKDGAFVVRKWKTKSKTVKSPPVYAKDVNRYGTTMEVGLAKKFAGTVSEAEVFLWSKTSKRLERIPVSVQGVNKGRFSFDVRQFVERQGGTLNKRWEAYLVMNKGGGYCLSRIEAKRNQKWERKRKAASRDGTEFIIPKRKKRYDEDGRFFGGVAYKPARDYSYEVVTGAEQTEFLWMPYYTEEMQLACKFVPRREYYLTQMREIIDDVKIRGGVCQITTMNIHHDFFDYHDLVIRYRNQGASPDEAMGGDGTWDGGSGEEASFSLVSTKKYAYGVKQVWRLPFKDVSFKQYIWDIILVGDRDGYDYEVRPINLDGKRFHDKVYRGWGNDYRDGGGRIVFPYVTENDNVVLFCRQWQKYDLARYALKEKVARLLYRCLRWYFKGRPILLLYEKHCMMAQDNSYAMFLYLTGEESAGAVKRSAYYIIDKSQPDYRNVAAYGRKVLPFMGVRHLVYLQAARLFVSIDSKRHAYIWRSRNSRILDAVREKPFLFLQHGVIGLKCVDYIYKKGGVNSANHVVVASDREKEITKAYFGYGESEIIVAGMARWDQMEDRSKTKRDILLMPTWRNWLQEVTEDVFTDSDYYRHYSDLLHSQELEEFLEGHDLRLIFCMHPKFRQFMDNYQVKSDRIQLFDYDAKPIIDLVMECRLLITDYSSVSWDVYYLGKPIIFYQFDYNKYMEWQGSYYDMRKDLFGPRVFDGKALLETLGRYQANDFGEEERFKEMRAVCLPKSAESVCKIIYDEIKRTYFKHV